MGRIAMCALPAAVQAFSQKERKTETSVAPLLMGRTAFCGVAEGRGRGARPRGEAEGRSVLAPSEEALGAAPSFL